MDSELTLLLHLQKLALSFPTDQSALTTVAPEALIADALAGLLAERELHGLQEMLAKISAGGMGAAEAWRLANNLALLIKAKHARADQIAARAALDHIVEEMLKLRLVADSQLLEHIDLPIKSVKLFDYIARLEIDPVPGAPATVIIGTLPQAISQPDVTVSSKHDTYIERRTEIVYRGGSHYPRLNINIRSRRGGLDMKNTRFDWHQRPFPEFDLDICTFQERRIGRIQTRSRELPYTVEGRKLSVTIPKHADTSLLETSILDEKQAPLIRCIRLITAQEAIAHQA